MKRLVVTIVFLFVAVPAYSQGSCILQQSTAGQILGMGPFVSSTDGNTNQNSLTINNTDIRIKKAGAAWVSKNSGGATFQENGWYQITLDATDTNTTGIMEISIHVAGALAVWKTCWVEANFVRSNFNLYFQNGGSATTKIVNDTGGGSGTTDWTATERDQIRFRLGIDGSTQTPAATQGLVYNHVKKNVAGQSVYIVFYSTGVTVKTGLGGTFTCTLYKYNAGAWGAGAGSTGTKTEVGNGLYNLTISQTESNADALYVFCTGDATTRQYTAVFVTEK